MADMDDFRSRLVALLQDLEDLSDVRDWNVVLEKASDALDEIEGLDAADRGQIAQQHAEILIWKA
ncbi:hypothetical protein RXV86_22010, partial [Alisedimentitalea sp. MJ-SS2]|uniref:hypothetical protein n=1 Tax=Aliisedimentitalea sp. MJ-SS2 TaxID=3049795 RepID=UPI002909AAD5